ncbi:MAG: calcium-binding protein [Gemmobacter sp.]|nr:calcium-binding protein [Gemmobacter sp.]
MSKSYLDAERAEDYSRGAGDVAPLIEMLREVRHGTGDHSDILLNISAWSVSGGGSSRDAPSLSAAASSIALFASMNELGASMSSAWGVRDTGPENVNLSYVNSKGDLVFTHAAEAYKLMAESLVGTKLLDTGNYSKAEVDKQPYFLKAYADDIKVVFFVTAGKGGAQNVKIRLDDFGAIGKVFGTRLGTVDENGRIGGLHDMPSVGDAAVSVRGSTLFFQTNQLHEVVRIVVYKESDIVGAEVTGSQTADNLVLPRASVVTHALAGNDTIISGGGRADVLCGAGNDIFYGGKFADTAYGGTGSDRIMGNNGADHLVGLSGNDTIHGGLGADYLSGGAGQDRIFADSNRASDLSFAYVFSAGDTLFGGAGDDIIHGASGHDYAYGGNGNDRISAGAGQDKVYGGSGDDTIFGGTGKDYLYGGEGRDLFVFKDESESLRKHMNRDTIVDFEHGRDLIDMRSISVGASDWEFRNARFFTGTGNEIIFYRTADGNSLICADIDGDRVSDFSIKVLNSIIEHDDLIF